jgi:hypothetical protein
MNTVTIPEDAIYTNKEDWDNSFWMHKYLISMPAIGTNHFAVNASCEGDAMDEVIDYCEKKQWYIMTDEDREEEEYLDEYVMGGNHGIYLNVPYHEVRIEVL